MGSGVVISFLCEPVKRGKMFDLSFGSLLSIMFGVRFTEVFTRKS